MSNELLPRLERLERTVARQRVLMLLLGGVALVGTLGAALAPQLGERLVQAREFALLDRAGALRARLALTPGEDPNPFLELLDAQGRSFARLGAHPLLGSEPALILHHAGGPAALELLGGDSGPELALRGVEGQASVWLSAADPASPRISLHEESGEGRVVLGVTEGSGFVSVFREVEDGQDLRVESSFHVPPRR